MDNSGSPQVYKTADDSSASASPAKKGIAPAQRRFRPRIYRQTADILACLAVEVTPHAVRMSVLPSAPFTVENFKVLRRPVDLRARAL